MSEAAAIENTADEKWAVVCPAADVPSDAGTCAVVDGMQIAIFYIPKRDAYYAVQNRCPHWNEMVLWRGMTGDDAGRPKVACPMHKKTFALETGDCLTEDTDCLHTFGVRVVDGMIEVERPSPELAAREQLLAASPSLPTGER